jgi:septal ring factor EnvC (AmiA/AmiB activator)
MATLKELQEEVQALQATINAEQEQIAALLAQNAALIEEKNALIDQQQEKIEELDAIILNLQEQIANGVTPDQLGFLIGELKTASADIKSTIPDANGEEGEDEPVADEPEENQEG